MIRRFAFAALLLGAVACGDDGDDNKPTPDAGGTDAGADAGYTPVPDRVTNVGEACTAATECEGAAGKTCTTSISLLGPAIAFPGGYCSATCQANIECGTGGECPVGESLKNSPIPIPGGASGLIPSYCYKTCTADTDCRTDVGYRCATIASALTPAGGGGGGGVFDIGSIIGMLPGQIRDSKYCLPPAPPPADGGVSDAGTSDASTSDAGDGDAGTGDAATGDAAAADATVDAAP